MSKQTKLWILVANKTSIIKTNNFTFHPKFMKGKSLSVRFKFISEKKYIFMKTRTCVFQMFCCIFHFT